MWWNTLSQTSTVSLLFIGWVLLTISRWSVQRTELNPLIAERVGVAVFLIWLITDIVHCQYLELAHLLETCLHGIGLGMVTCGAFGILTVIFSTFWFHFWTVPTSRISTARGKQRQLQQERRNQLEAQRLEASRKLEWERAAPEREYEQRMQEQTEQQRIDHQYRREAARLGCQLFYDQHAPQLQERFPRERIAEYFEQYLSDLFPADLVENRDRQLIGMIESSLEQAGGNQQRFANLMEIASYFEQQKQEIASLNYDEPTRQSFFSSLTLQEDQAIREFLKS